jgi:hypothetical protein
MCDWTISHYIKATPTSKKLYLIILLMLIYLKSIHDMSSNEFTAFLSSKRHLPTRSREFSSIGRILHYIRRGSEFKLQTSHLSILKDEFSSH